MATTRVHILAKELGVKSSAIVKKCQDEGLEQITNHMAMISAGLAATIREWFSEGEHTTAVETAEKVDLKKVRVRSKRKQMKGEETEVEGAIAGEQEEEMADAAEGVSGEVEEAAEGGVEAGAGVEVSEEKEGEVEAGAGLEPEPEPEPEPIMPAGPMLEKPEPAKLNGPQIVRVEAPEPEVSYTRRPPRRPKYDSPVTEPLMPVDEGGTVDVKSEKGKRPVGRHKERTHGRRHEDRYDEMTRRAKFEYQRRQKDIEERRARLSAAGGEGLRARPSRKIASKSGMGAAPSARPEKVTISEPIVVKDLSAAMAVKTSDIIAKLMEQGVMATANQVISPEAAELAAMELGTELVVERKSSLEDQIREEFEKRERKNLVKRPVVATMLGHVDHGKTSLLDKIRSTSVTAGEAGGITQHIGAYQVSIDGKKVTFLDTPGHEAFTAMRARGANMTDVVVLVVAADDGVMQQTVEAIHHAKAAGVEVIVALNKCDLPGCDFNRIYSQLAEHELAPVEWGGKTEVVKTSAITGEGIEDLLEHLDYVTELLDLKADDTIPATGWVVEAKMSSQRGAVATLLIKEGQFQRGDIVLAGSAYGRVKAMRDSFGKNVKRAVSSMPVEVTGLDGVPEAGDRFYCLDDINRAKQAAEENRVRSREKSLSQRSRVTLENLFSHIEAGSIKELNIIIKADVQGSVDVLTKYLSELSTEEVKIKILHAGTGGITEGDVVLAEASNAIIIGFNVIAEDRVAKMAETEGVDIRLYNVIYRITEDLRKSMEGMLEPEEHEKAVGRATVRETFKVSRIGTIAGCYVTDGVARKNAKVRLIRDSVVIRDNLAVESLKHFKDDAREVRAGMECGVKIARYDDVKIGDVLDFYEIVEVARTL